jgi:hypothetical protein
VTPPPELISWARLGDP